MNNLELEAVLLAGDPEAIVSAVMLAQAAPLVARAERIAEIREELAALEPERLALKEAQQQAEGRAVEALAELKAAERARDLAQRDVGAARLRSKSLVEDRRELEDELAGLLAQLRADARDATGSGRAQPGTLERLSRATTGHQSDSRAQWVLRCPVIALVAVDSLYAVSYRGFWLCLWFCCRY